MAMATKSKKRKPPVVERVEIPELGRDRRTVRAVGLSPLVVHSMTAKARKEMLDKKEHKKTTRQPCDPRREYLESFYWMDDHPFLEVVCDYSQDPSSMKKAQLEKYRSRLEGAIQEGMKQVKSARFGVPSVAVKSAFVRGAKGLEGLDMITTRGLLFIDGEYSRHANMELIPIISKKPPAMLESVISVKSGARDLRWRPVWEEWALEFDIEFETEVFDAESVLNLGRRGGSRCGICEGRPEKTALGWGRFDLR